MCAWLSSGELSFQAPSWHPRISLCWMGVRGERGGRTRRLCARRGRSGALGSAAAVAGDLCAPSLSRWISQPGLHSSPRLPGATTHVGSGSPKTGSGFENASPLRPPTPVAFGNQGLGDTGVRRETVGSYYPPKMCPVSGCPAAHSVITGQSR